jgi:hypothetical protein
MKFLLMLIYNDFIVYFFSFDMISYANKSAPAYSC